MAARLRRPGTSLIAIAAWTLLFTRGASAFELPGLGTILGTQDPLAVFPHSLPEAGSLRAAGEYREFYRSKQGPRLQEFGLWNAQGLLLVRANPLWIGVRYGKDRMSLSQREVWGAEDVFVGERNVNHLAIALAARGPRGELRLLAGASREVEFAVDSRTAWGPFLLVRGRGWMWRSDSDLSQEIRGTKFYFPFEYTDTSAEISLITRSFGDTRLRALALHQRIDGEKPVRDQYNLLNVRRWRGEVGFERVRGLPIDGTLALDRPVIDVEMAVNGTVYARTENLRASRWLAEVGWKAAQVVRFAAGYDRWELKSDDKSFFEAWPFTVWDVFSATRYRLESIDQQWDTFYTRISWHPHVSRAIQVGLDTRLEWWNAAGTLHWKDRVAVLHPFFFRFDHHFDSFAPSFRGGAQLDALIHYSFVRGTFLRLDAQVLAPLGKSDGESSEGDSGETLPKGPKRSERGGLRLRLALGSDW